jgi:hypothetical protein
LTGFSRSLSIEPEVRTNRVLEQAQLAKSKPQKEKKDMAKKGVFPIYAKKGTFFALRLTFFNLFRLPALPFQTPLSFP